MEFDPNKVKVEYLKLFFFFSSKYSVKYILQVFH